MQQKIHRKSHNLTQLIYPGKPQPEKNQQDVSLLFQEKFTLKITAASSALLGSGNQQIKTFTPFPVK
jgi:hypothetical protein